MRCCARCGNVITDGHTSASRDGVTAFYCDDQASLTTTCYYYSKYQGFPELNA